MFILGKKNFVIAWLGFMIIEQTHQLFQKFKEYIKYEAKHAFSEISSNLKRISISFQLQRHCILFVPCTLTCFLLMLLPAPTTAARQSSPEVTAACHHLFFPSPLLFSLSAPFLILSSPIWILTGWTSSGLLILLQLASHSAN